MPSRSKSILFYALILTAAALMMIKTAHIWRFFEPETEDKTETSFRFVLPADEETRRIREDLARQRREIEIQTAELKALSAEIDDKLESLREAEENILRLIREKEGLADELPRNPDEIIYDEPADNSDSGDPVIIELAPADE